MRKFQFRLDKVLRYREHLEELQRMETHRAEEDLHRSLEDARVIDADIHRTAEILSPEPGTVWRAADQHAAYRYAILLRVRMAEAETRIQESAVSLQRERQHLLERSREKKTLQKLEQRKFLEWSKESEKEEGSMLDETGLRSYARSRESGKAILTGILVLACLGMGALCFTVWKNWFEGGGTGVSWLREPFDHVADKQVRTELEQYESDQRMRRERRDREAAESPIPADQVAAAEQEGYKRTIQRIRQKEETLQTREEELDSRESILQQAQEDFRREMNRLNNLQRRISEELASLKALEDKRNQEMSAEHKAKLTELVASVKTMSPKRAASLLFATAFPEQLLDAPPPLTVGRNLEGIELVVEVMLRLPSREKGAILDAMTREAPEKAALVLERLDNVKTGLEEDRFFQQPPSPATP